MAPSGFGVNVTPLEVRADNDGISSICAPVVENCPLMPAISRSGIGASHASPTVTRPTPDAVPIRALAYLVSVSRLL